MDGERGILMKKLIIIIPVLLLIGVAAYFIWGREKSASNKFLKTAVQRGDIEVSVTATGTLQAVTTVLVGSQVSGTISSLYADFNDNVRKGQILAQLDPNFLKAQVTQAEADLEKSQASSNLAQREYERAQSLFDRDMISESDRDASQAKLEQAKADVKSSEANVERLKTNLNYSTIVSPIDGVVISRDVDVGQTVAASLSAPTLYTIAQDLTKMEVKTSVDEADIGKVKDGLRARFTVDAYPDLKFDATVKQIRLSPQIESNVVSYAVILDVFNPDLLLKPGMTANVTIEIDHRENVLKIANSALRYRPAGFTPGGGQGLGRNAGQRRHDDGANASQTSDNSQASSPDSTNAPKANRTRIWTMDKTGQLRPVPIETGISDGSLTEIVWGDLAEGDSIIIGQEGVVSSTNNQQVNPFAPRFPGRR